MKLSLRQVIGLVVLLFFISYPMLPGLNDYFQRVIGKNIGDQLTVIYIYGILALALNVAVGYTGLLHLGIAAFFGLGVYITGILTVGQYPFQYGFLVTLMIATFGTAIVGAILSVPMLRVRGDYLALVTLGIGVIMVMVLKNFGEITDGTKSLSPIPPPKMPEVLQNSLIKIGFGTDWATDYRLYYYLMIGFLLFTFWLLRNIEHSRLGRAWVALREDELAGSCMGLNSARLKLYAFTLSAGLAGMAGCLYATKMTTTTDPSKFDFSISATTLACLILGGLGNRTGVLLGVFLIWGYDFIVAPIVDSQLQQANINPDGKGYLRFSMWNLMIYGIALILMMRFRPMGLLPTARDQEAARKAAAVERGAK